MDREEAVELFREGAKGVAKWNAWRRENPDAEMPHARSFVLDMLNRGGATPIETDLSNAQLSMANLRGFDFRGTNLSGARLRGANLSGADLSGANFSNADVAGVIFDREMRCLGARVATCFGSSLFKREVEDLAYVEEFERRHPPLFKLRRSGISRIQAEDYSRELDSREIWFGGWAWAWRFFCDYGRSFKKLFYWFSFFALLFASFYTWPLADSLNWDTNYPPNNYVEVPSSANFESGLYYSIVTLTTLGFGDIVPTKGGAKFVVVCEVILGYTLLGLLISVLADKVARRS